MKYIKQYEDYNLKYWNIIGKIQEILNKCINDTFDTTIAVYYNKYIKIERNNKECTISLSTLGNSFIISLSFDKNDCEININFDCHDKLKNSIYENLIILLDEISSVKGHWNFDIDEFMSKSSNIDTIKDIKKYNL